MGGKVGAALGVMGSVDPLKSLTDFTHSSRNWGGV